MNKPSYRSTPLLLGTAALVVGVAGCASPGSSSYDHQDGVRVGFQNSVSTSVPFEQTWDQFVAQLSQSFFVINNIAKDSRIINVSFNSDSPELYVDCGVTERSFEFKEETQNYSYQTAGSSSYKAAHSYGANLPAVSDINRRASVEGRANIYVAPTAGGATVSVNAVYVWTVTISGVTTGYTMFGDVAGRQAIDPSTTTVRLTTSEPGAANWGDGTDSTCFVTGKFEEDILSLVPRGTP